MLISIRQGILNVFLRIRVDSLQLISIINMGCNPSKDMSSVIIVHSFSTLMRPQNNQTGVLNFEFNTVTSDNNARLPKEKIEEALIREIIRQKKNIINSNIKFNTDNFIIPSERQNPWIEMEKILANTNSKAIRVDSLELFNRKVFEKFDLLLQKFVNLQELYLENCRIESIPQYLPMTIQKLSVKQNNIKELIMHDFPNLEYFDASYNKISVLPPLSPNIRILILTKNQITEVQDSIFLKMIILKDLNLSGNQISLIDISIKHFVDISTINLSFNQISELPSRFFHSGSLLTNLYLNNNPLRFLHPRIGLLDSLRRLDLRSTALKELPSTLVDLRELQFLNLSNISLVFPPMHVANQGLEKVIEFLREHPVPLDPSIMLSDNEGERESGDNAEGNEEVTFGVSYRVSRSIVRNSTNNTRSQSAKEVIDRNFYYAMKVWIESHSGENQELCKGLK